MKRKDLIKQGERRRERVYKFVVRYIDKNGMSPTLQEIADGVDLQSANATRAHLEALVEQGRINRRPKVARGITLVKEKSSASACTSASAQRRDAERSQALV